MFKQWLNDPFETAIGFVALAVLVTSVTALAVIAGAFMGAL